MAKYTLMPQGGVTVSGTGAYVPPDPDNKDWQEYLTWSETNIPDMEDPLDPWIDAREIRNSLLAECDWTQISDSPLDATKKSEWAGYRDTLRNIPQTYDNVEDIIWPEKPE